MESRCHAVTLGDAKSNLRLKVTEIARIGRELAEKVSSAVLESSEAPDVVTHS